MGLVSITHLREAGFWSLRSELDGERHGCAMIGTASNPAEPAEMFCFRAEAPQSVAAMRTRRVKSPSVIADDHLEKAIMQADTDLDHARLRMFCDVRDDFLKRKKHASFEFNRDGFSFLRFQEVKFKGYLSEQR